jgi:tRNA pseudouridine55 synthase
MDGILLVDKPAGWTSFDVVAKIRNILKRDTGQKVKVGHTGTLDPLATGLLVILVGNYTKRASELSKLDKTYEVSMKLGQTSTTGDEEGEKEFASERVPSSEELQAAMGRFMGEIMQTPHAYSAIKVDGQRAYKLARAGKEVTIEPRPVTIYSITDIACTYPEIKFTTKVSSGTYIRSLVEDIGKELGTGAYMSALRRTQVGKFEVKEALLVEKLDIKAIKTRIVH